jgi:hypothetical protein
MKKTILLAGVMLAMAGTAFAASSHDYDLFVIANADTEKTVYVVVGPGEMAAIEVDTEDKANSRWISDRQGRKAISWATGRFGPGQEGRKKGFAFVIKDDDVEIAFGIPFFKHVSVHANGETGAVVDITSKDGEKDVTVRADDDGAFISVTHTSAHDAAEFIDDINKAPKSLRREMKEELELD